MSDIVPALECVHVTEQLLREEQKLKDNVEADNSKKLLMVKGRKQFTRHSCKKPGHFKKDCRASERWEAEKCFVSTKERATTIPGCYEDQPCTSGKVKGLDSGFGNHLSHVHMYDHQSIKKYGSTSYLRIG